MARPDLDGFAGRLVRHGVSGCVATRMQAELADHYEDLVERAVATPVACGLQAAPAVGRWMICAVTSASITAAMMLVLTLTILPG